MIPIPSGYNAGDTIYFPFDTYDSTGASVTMTGLAVTDIEVYKNGSVTQRSSDNGYALLDTDGIDFDGTTGLHGFSIDTSDNSDSGFWTDGATYWVNVNAVTVDSKTVRFTYLLTLGLVLRPVTAGRKLVVDSAGLGDANMVKAGPSGSGTAQTARDIGGAVPAAAAGASGGLLISGSNSGTTTLAEFTVTGALTVSNGVIITASTTNRDGFSSTGNGTGSGALFTSGSGNSNGMKIVAAGSKGAGLSVAGVGVSSGAIFSGGATGAGVSIAGGVTSGVGLDIAQGTGSNAITITGPVATTGTVAINAFTVTNLLSINGTSNVAQTGDSYGRIGATGSGLTSLASASNLSTANTGIADLQARTPAALSAGGWTKVDIQSALGVAINDCEFTCATDADADTTRLTLPTTYTDTTSLPNDASHFGKLIEVVSGTGKGQWIVLVSRVGSTRQWNVVGQTTQTDNTSKCITRGRVTGPFTKNAGVTTVPFMMTDSTNHAPAPSKTVTCTRSINGAAFGAGTLANVTEVANGMYTVDFLNADYNGKTVTLRATATGCDDTFVTFYPMQ